MKKLSKITAFLLTLVLCISMLGAVFCFAEHSFHKCTGTDCAVCAVLAQCDQRLRGAVPVASAVLLLMLFAQYADCLPDSEIREAAGKTPVSLKVRLLD